MQNQEPQKWREGIDPFTLPLQTLQISEILGYPHAANQVFYVRGCLGGYERNYYIKYAFHADAHIQQEAEILKRLDSPLVPKVVEYDVHHNQYIVTEQIYGSRLSLILAEAGLENAAGYLYEYGRTLAQLHKTKGDFPKAPCRSFHKIPDEAHFAENTMEEIGQWLKVNKPQGIHECFVHGDFHYANILWHNDHISGILDFELAGMGNREFDIAWALILRPGQRFLKTREEQREFLDGYHSLCHYDGTLVRYYMVMIYVRFLKLGDSQYEAYVRDWLQKAIYDHRCSGL